MITQIEITNDLDNCFDLRRLVFIDEQKVPIEEEIDEFDRVCVLATARGQGPGAGLICKALEIAADLGGVTPAKLGAQLRAIGFDEALGFTAFGSTYLDAGIGH